MKIDYKSIFINLIKDKFPEKLRNPNILWKLEHLDSTISVLDLNKELFQKEEIVYTRIDSRLRSYTEEEIIRILKYQKKYKITNIDLVRKYGISRTTLSTWRKRFKKQLDLLIK